MLIRVILIFLGFLLLRRVLGWAFGQWSRLLGNNARQNAARQAAAKSGPVGESLSDQSIDEADYEELN